MQEEFAASSHSRQSILYSQNCQIVEKQKQAQLSDFKIIDVLGAGAFGKVLLV